MLFNTLGLVGAMITCSKCANLDEPTQPNSSVANEVTSNNNPTHDGNGAVVEESIRSQSPKLEEAEESMTSPICQIKIDKYKEYISEILVSFKQTRACCILADNEYKKTKKIYEQLQNEINVKLEEAPENRFVQKWKNSIERVQWRFRIARHNPVESLKVIEEAITCFNNLDLNKTDDFLYAELLIGLSGSYNKGWQEGLLAVHNHLKEISKTV
ncbi:hypothetical protein ENBRE01_2763, partial [Enteropsectra breve]